MHFGFLNQKERVQLSYWVLSEGDNPTPAKIIMDINSCCETAVFCNGFRKILDKLRKVVYNKYIIKK